MKLFIKNYIKTTIIMATIIVAIFVCSTLSFGTANPFFIVSSGSMIPVLNVYDVIMLQENVPFDKIKVGDIIAFFSPTDHSEIIVHRVVQVMSQNPLEIRTKGDANLDSIQGVDLPITKSNYLGKVAFVIPKMGYIGHILVAPVNYVIGAAMMGIMVIMITNSSGLQKRKIF